MFEYTRIFLLLAMFVSALEGADIKAKRIAEYAAETEQQSSALIGAEQSTQPFFESNPEYNNPTTPAIQALNGAEQSTQPYFESNPEYNNPTTPAIQALNGAEQSTQPFFESNPEYNNPTAPAIQALEDADIKAKRIAEYAAETEQESSDFCPSGFTYLPFGESCYKAVFESLDWDSAAKRCQSIQPGSHLVAITNTIENSELKTFLTSELSSSKNLDNTTCISRWPQYGRTFWTSGQRQLKNNCKSPFLWKLHVSSTKHLPLQYTNWLQGEANCALSDEDCLYISVDDQKFGYGWNDLRCSEKMCPVCEFKP